jgi:hypothetical protein
VISNLVLVALSRKNGLILTRFLVVLLLLACMPGTNAKEPPTVWHLKYLGQGFARDVFISANAIKIENGPGNTVLSKAPNWDACLFNRKSKRIMRLPLSKWQKTGLGVFEADVESFTPNQRVEDNAKVMGLPVVHYSSQVKISDDFFRARRAPRAAKNVYYGTTAIPVNDMQRMLFCFWFGIPQTKELPMLWFLNFADGTTRYDVKILDISKEPYNSHAFEEPSNYTSVRTTREIFVKDIPAVTTDLLDMGAEHK